MKKNTKISPKESDALKARRILDVYENQSDEEAAHEIETAPRVVDSTWVKVPAKLLPRVRKLLAQERKSA